MISNSFSLYSAKIFANLLKDILYFPLWWYSRGFKQLLVKLRNFLADKERSLALLVWIKNIFRPMYGQYDWAGLIISFLMRFLQIIFRGVIMFFWFLVAITVACFWLLLPLLVMYEIIFQIAL